ncbi:MAG: hypothetical protein ACJ8B6_14340, partial [Gemmatimonadales bacterium]
MLRRLVPFMLLALVPTTLAGQAADSAAVARASYRAALEALRAGDSAAAQSGLARAAAAFPQQPAYPGALARLAAIRGDRAV